MKIMEQSPFLKSTEVLDLGDLLTIIRLTEIELLDLKNSINGEDETEKNNAGEIIIHVDNLATKLKDVYEAQWEEGSNYPRYAEFIKAIKQYPPFEDGININS